MNSYCPHKQPQNHKCGANFLRRTARMVLVVNPQVLPATETNRVSGALSNTVYAVIVDSFQYLLILFFVLFPCFSHTTSYIIS